MSAAVNDLTDLLTAVQKAKIEMAFSIFDIDGDGSTTPVEWSRVMRSLGLTPTAAELDYMMLWVGSFDFPEFQRFMARKIRESDRHERLQPKRMPRPPKRRRGQ